MAASDLRALLAESDVARLLSRHELSTLRAAATGGARSVALLHGIPEEGAQRQIDAVKAKLEAARNGDPSSAASRVVPGAASTPPALQAPRPDGGSTRRPRGPAIEPQVLAYLRDHAEGSQAQMRAAFGCDKSRLSEVVRQLQHERKVRLVRKDGRVNMYALGGESAQPIAASPDLTIGDGQGSVRNVMQEGARDAEAEAERVAAELNEEPPKGYAPVPAVEPGPVERLVTGMLGVSGSAVAPPRVFVGLWDVLLADGAHWTAEHTHAYVAAARELYAAYGGEA